MGRKAPLLAIGSFLAGVFLSPVVLPRSSTLSEPRVANKPIGFIAKAERLPVRRVTPATSFIHNGRHYLMVEGGRVFKRAYCFETQVFEFFELEQVVQLGELIYGERN